MDTITSRQEHRNGAGAAVRRSLGGSGQDISVAGWRWCKMDRFKIRLRGLTLEVCG